METGMARRVSETLGVIAPRSGHLDAMEVAAYVDGALAADVRQRVEAHLADCVECRDEVVDASRLAAQVVAPKAPRWRLLIPVAAAAALLLMVRGGSREDPLDHREAPVTTTVAPRGLTPVGPVDSVGLLAWSSVPSSDAYRVRLFAGDGTVIWDGETRDTTIALPASVALESGRLYFWKVEAQTGFGRSAATELIEFSVRRGP
jgi:hypothetical protein